MPQILSLLATPKRYFEQLEVKKASSAAALVQVIAACTISGLLASFWTWFLSIQRLWRQYIPMLVLSFLLPAVVLLFQYLFARLIIRLFAAKDAANSRKYLLPALSTGMIGYMLPNTFLVGPGLLISVIVQLRALYQFAKILLYFHPKRAFIFIVAYGVPFMTLGLVLLWPFLPFVISVAGGILQMSPDPVNVHIVFPKK